MSCGDLGDLSAHPPRHARRHARRHRRLPRRASRCATSRETRRRQRAVADAARSRTTTAGACPTAATTSARPTPCATTCTSPARSSRSCIAAGRDETLGRAVLGQRRARSPHRAGAHAAASRCMLDVALNHFGHNYLLLRRRRLRAGARPRRRAARTSTICGTSPPPTTRALLHPTLVDDPAALGRPARSTPCARAARRSSGDALVRAYHQWRDAFDWERAQFRCDGASLEYQLPGFYLGGNAWDPSTAARRQLHQQLARREVPLPPRRQQRAPRGSSRARASTSSASSTTGCRAASTASASITPPTTSAALAPNEWKYVTSQGRLLRLAARAGAAALPRRGVRRSGRHEPRRRHPDRGLRRRHVPAATGRPRTARYVERVVDNMQRFGGHTFVMSALETHDEKRLVDGTGFDAWTGAGFWGIGATTWSTPMILMGQELGEAAAARPSASRSFLAARFAPPSRRRRARRLLQRR